MALKSFDVKGIDQNGEIAIDQTVNTLRTILELNIHQAIILKGHHLVPYSSHLVHIMRHN